MYALWIFIYAYKNDIKLYILTFTSRTMKIRSLLHFLLNKVEVTMYLPNTKNKYRKIN